MGIMLCLIIALAGIIALQYLTGRGTQRKLEVEQEHSVGLLKAYEKMKERAERLERALAGNAAIGKEADDEKNELDSTADSDLVGRANTLFNVHDNE